MAASAETLDELIMYLIGMGFEVDDCQEAIQAGKLSVQEAVDWLLQGKPSAVQSKSGKLVLHPTRSDVSGSSLNAFVPPVSLSSIVSSSVPSNTSDKSHEEEMLTSRMHMSDEQAHIRDQFEARQRDEARRRAQQEKLLQKKAKQDALKRIQEDREKLKKPKLQPVSTVTSSSTPNTSTAPSTDTGCLLQLRLPDGKSVRQRFQPTDTLNAVRSHVQSVIPDLGAISLIQPFPRKEFQEDIYNSHSLQELGLTPTGSLVVKKYEGLLPAPAKEQLDGALPDTLMDSKERDDEDDKDDDTEPPEYEWGLGQELGADDNDENNEIADTHHADDVNVVAGVPTSPMPGLGQRLDDMYGRDIKPGLPASHLAAEAAKRRITPVVQDGASTSKVNVPKQLKHLVPLLQCCIKIVCTKLRDHSHCSLGGVPTDLAMKLLEHLIQEKMLNARTLKPFLHCKLRKIILDCYPYVTNELLNNLRHHIYIQHLSLSSCTVFNDRGLQPLTNLHKLKVLNLSSCQQLTDKVLLIIAEFPHLTTLILEDTGITDTGVITYAQSCPCDLHTLNLNKTSVTQAVLPNLSGITNLRNLSLENTRVNSLSGIEGLKNLKSLNVCGTGIVAESIILLKNLSSLIALNIAQTNNLNGDKALEYITELRLQQLEMPSRHSVTDSGIKYLTGMDLRSLDLTNYIHITDESTRSIGCIRSLRRLLLGNTKITDVGLLYLEGLTNLEVLYLDRTGITDNGMEVLKALSNLNEVSLSETAITSRCLLNGCFNNCALITKLNFSKTRVSNKGIEKLKLPYLTLLNLDGTCVTVDIMASIKDCPNIKRMTLSNLRRPEPNIDEEETN